MTYRHLPSAGPAESRYEHTPVHVDLLARLSRAPRFLGLSNPLYWGLSGFGAFAVWGTPVRALRPLAYLGFLGFIPLLVLLLQLVISPR